MYQLFPSQTTQNPFGRSLTAFSPLAIGMSFTLNLRGIPLPSQTLTEEWNKRERRNLFALVWAWVLCEIIARHNKKGKGGMRMKNPERREKDDWVGLFFE